MLHSSHTERVDFQLFRWINFFGESTSRLILENMVYQHLFAGFLKKICYSILCTILIGLIV